MSFPPLRFVKNNLTVDCYVCAKCGSSTLEDWYEKLPGLDFKENNIHYKFLVIRNPFMRLYSFYSDKIVKRNFVKRTGNLLYGNESSRFNTTGDIIEGCSFRELVNRMFQEDKRGNRFEAHLESQVDHIGLTKEFIDSMDLVVRLEDFSEGMTEVCSSTGIPPDSILRKLVGASNKVEGTFNNVSDLKREDFLKLGGVPKDYKLFYDDDLVNKVSQMYSSDLSLLNYTFDGVNNAT